MYATSFRVPVGVVCVCAVRTPIYQTAAQWVFPVLDYIKHQNN